MRKPELLAPAGSLSRLKMAIEYGADAVYLGGEAYSLRAAAENFSPSEMAEGIAFAHKRGKKVYITANIFPHNADLNDLEQYLKEIAAMGADAVIVSDLGAVDLVREAAPELDVHISTQANNINYRSAQAYYKLGAKRVVVARELSLAEIREIRVNIPSDMEIEAFVHGAMCISYSGRCLLSNYMTMRDSNRGACSHPCRWNYALMEEKRPGEYFPVYENERGTFIFNSKDLCMIGHIPELIEAGISSFKIEGRVKTDFYVATVVKAYREAIDSYVSNPEKYQFNPALFDELQKVSHRKYTTGFYLGKPDADAQVYASSSYIRTYDLIGYIKSYDAESGLAVIEQRNRFFLGDKVEVVAPKGPFFTQKINFMQNEAGEKIECAPHAQMLVTIKLDHSVTLPAFLRKARNENMNGL